MYRQRKTKKSHIMGTVIKSPGYREPKVFKDVKEATEYLFGRGSICIKDLITKEELKSMVEQHKAKK